MATRKSEWLASIKPILDRDEAKRDAKELAKELGDILEINIDANPENLKQLTDEFNQQLTKMGKQPIVFSEKTLQGIVSQFAGAVAEGFSKGANVGLEETFKLQLANLKKQKEALLKEQDDINRRLSNRSKIEKINNFAIENAHVLPIDGDAVKQAEQLLDQMYEYADRISELQAEQGKESKEYISTVLDAQEAYNKFLRMQKTLQKIKPALPKDLKAAYGLFEGEDKYNYKAAGGKAIAFDEDKYGGQIIYGAFEELSDVLIDAGDELKKIKLELKDIDAQIETISNKAKAAGVIGDDIFTESKDGLKTLQEIEAAYDRISQKKKKDGREPIEDVVSAVEYIPGSESLTTIRNRYNKSLSSSEDWETQYQWLVKFVKEYENYSAQIEAETDSIKRKNMKARQKQYTALYEELKPMAENAEAMLRGIIDASIDKPLGDKGIGSEVRVAAKVREKESSKPGGILDNPAFAHMFKKSGEQAEVSGVEAVNNSLTKQSGLLENIQKLTTYIDDEYLSAGKHLADFLNDIQAESAELDTELKEILTTLNLIDENGEPTFTVKRKDEDGGGTTHNGALISDEFVLIERGDYENVKDSRLPDVTQKAAKDGVNVAEILGYLPSKHAKGFFDVQSAAKGHNLFEDGVISQDVVNATEDQLEQLIQAFIKARDYGFNIENGGSNIVYDKEKGFSFYDLEELSVDEAEFWNSKNEAEKKLIALEDLFSLFSGINIDHGNFKNDEGVKVLAERIKGIVESKGIVNSNDVDDIGRNYEDIYDDVFSGNIEDEFAEIMTQLRAETDVHKQKVAAIKEEAVSAEQAVEAVGDVIQDTQNPTQQGDVAFDDDVEVLAKENGQLEDKLELLRDIAEQYGINITQKQRDRLEELNQKDMDVGLSSKEEDRYWELGEQINQADENLEELEKTYDRIILKLANGKKVEILPDDKGLRSLAKFADGYGEEYNGVEIEDVIFERVQKAAQTAETAVNDLNESLEKTEQLTSGGETAGAGGVVGGIDPSELEAEKNKADALQTELEQKDKELAIKGAEITRIQQESDAKLKAAIDEKNTLQNDLDVTRQQLADSEYTRDLYDSAMNQLTEESNEKDRIIYDLREQLANVKTGVNEEQPSVNSEELKNVLSSIVYNVKIAHDDNDKNANKIALDESTLESTLRRVFKKELEPQIEQPDSEPKNEPWALEKTLQTVKETLDVIKTNTTKPESLEVAPAKTDVGNVLATENTLVAIKTAVEGINKKIVKGTKTSESGGKKKTGTGKKNSESYAGSQYFPEKLKTQTMQLAKFRAQLMTTGKLTDDVDAQIYELLDSLAQVKSGPDFSQWAQKFQQLKTSVGITDIFDKAEGKETTASYQQLIEFQKTRNKLELQYEKAQDGSALKQFYAEQLAQMDSVIAKQEEMLDNEEYEAKLAKIREEQARKLGEAEAKAADKDAKKNAAKAKRNAQRDAMLGKTSNAVGRAENTWMTAAGIEDLPDDFNVKMDEYYNKLEALRNKYLELKDSDAISEDDKQDIIAQTMNVNKLTEEIGELVSEYQKLSGDNATVIGTNTLDSDAGLGSYEQQLKQAVATATNGKAQIKNFDAATKTLTYTVKTGKNEFTEYTAAVRHLDGQLVSVQGTTKRTETFFEATARKMKELTSYFSGMAVFNQIGQELRRGIQYVREIDLALTELKKVTNETEETYDKFLETAAKTADKVGSTIQKVVSSTADWARLGSILANTNIRPII